MKSILLKLLSTALLVFVIPYFLHSVHVASPTTSLYVAVVLGLLNIFVKPIIVMFTLPVTIFSLGLFLLVINAVLIFICTKIVQGFVVDTFLGALIFSVVLSISQSIIYKFIKD
jgi:putative membrane protein